jgi:hypothetical protein
MYLEKPLDALGYLFRKHPHLNRQLIINGTTCEPAPQLLQKLYDQMEDTLQDTTFAFIHGDLTLSNMVADQTGHIYLIDPRGKFGSTPMTGDVRYDIAKLYYSCIANFDSLNHHRFTCTERADGQFEYTLDESLSDPAKTELFWHFFPENKQLISFINCSIWLSLFPHLEESDEQTLVTYLHGLRSLKLLRASIRP